MREYVKPILRIDHVDDHGVYTGTEVSVRDESADIGGTVIVAIVTGIVQGALENAGEEGLT